MSHEYKSTQGVKQRMETVPSGVNFVLRKTQLIRQQHMPMGEYLVTMMPPTRGDGVVPYVSTFDGAAYPPVGATIYTAPALPDPASCLQVSVDWGAGGIRYQTAFDYPALGGTFSITCDRMDISVGVKGNQAIAYNDINLVPVVGAFYVIGAPVDPTPMAWLEPVGGVLAGADAFWAVKPFSKELVFSVAGAATTTRIEFLNTLGTTLWSRQYVRGAGTSDIADVVQVPRQATVVRFVCLGGAATIYLEWGIGLS